MAHVILNATRDAYSADSVSSMTIDEVINRLRDFPKDAKLVISFDNGYTYGGINDDSFEY